MKKLILALAVISGFATSIFAQKSNSGKFSIGIESGLPLGKTSSISSYAIGGSFKYDQPVAAKFFITMAAGYAYFPYKSIFIAAYHTERSGEGFIPIKIGAKGYFCSNFYGEGQFGIVISTIANGGVAFPISPGIGYSFGRSVDLGMRYEAWEKADIRLLASLHFV